MNDGVYGWDGRQGRKKNLKSIYLKKNSINNIIF